MAKKLLELTKKQEQAVEVMGAAISSVRHLGVSESDTRRYVERELNRQRATR